MRLYLDEDLSSPVLEHLLRRAGHDVQLPIDAGLSGAADVIVFTRAIRENRVCLTRNYGDFEDLHNLVIEARGHHPGVLAIRRDNNPRRNMRPRDTVRAIRNLEAAGVPTADEYIILNAWQ